MQFLTLLLTLAITLVQASAWADDFHVAPGGSDGNPGTAELPWATIQHAANEAEPGDTVRISSGIYAERVVFPKSGTRAGGSITFKAAAGAEVIVDGTGQTVSGRQGLLEIVGKSYLRIEGLVVRSFQTTQRNRVPVGILVEGACDHVEIVGNEICDIASLATVNGSLDGRDAHGIGVFGNALSPISNLLIRDNDVHDLTLGSSEALVLNGNVTGFTVMGNEVSHCDNIGIDLIGFEGTAPSEELDQARNGSVSGNRVWRIDSGANPSYGGETSAGGIYVDGGRDIVIERNTVYLCNIGIEVASEHQGKVTRGITVRNNLIHGNEMGGLFIGGYNAGSTGDAEDCVITNNTFHDNDTRPGSDAYGQIYIQFRVSNCVFKNNILHPLVAKDGQFNAMIIQWNNTGSGNVIDHNLYFGRDTPLWRIRNVPYEGWQAYEEMALGGEEERFGDPEFADPLAEDFTPRGASAVGTGDITVVETGARDLEGDSISLVNSVDRGAIQRGKEPVRKLEIGLRRTDKAGSALELRWPTRKGYFYDVQVLHEGRWETCPGHNVLPGTGRKGFWWAKMGSGAGVFRVLEH